MRFRAVTLNMEQDHKRWDVRRELIVAQLGVLKPDMIALNEVCIPRQTARWLQKVARENFGIEYALVQQTRTNSLSEVDGEALLTRFPVVETGNLEYRTHDTVALVARVRVGEQVADIYVTHLYRSVGNDSLRLFQVQQLLGWIDRRDDVPMQIVCGDFNATMDMPSASLMASRLRPTQSEPTAFTPLAGTDGGVSHPEWPRMDRCIDYIWVSPAIEVVASGVCFNQPSAADGTLWPSDHAGVWADLSIG